MSERFSEDDVIATVTRLTRVQLSRFVEGALVKPEHDAEGYIFRRIDIARLELLCDLSDDLDLDETGLSIIVSLIDQLHAARKEAATLVHAIDALPTELRTHVLSALQRR